MVTRYFPVWICCFVDLITNIRTGGFRRNVTITSLTVYININDDIPVSHDDVIKWKHFPRNWPFVRSPVNSQHKGQWRGALMFSLICVWANGWVNNREAGDLRCHHAHFDVTVMNCQPARNNRASSPVIAEPSWGWVRFLYNAPDHVIRTRPCWIDPLHKNGHRVQPLMSCFGECLEYIFI